MDKLTRYRILVKQTLTERAGLMRSQPLPGEEIVCILDEATDNYLLLRLGWVQGKRLYNVTVHLRFAEGKIHIEQDWTDDVVSDLIAEGVSRADLVFAITTPPELRRLPDFAVA